MMKLSYVIGLISICVAFADMEMANTNVTPFDDVDLDSNGEIDFNEFEKWSKLKRKDQNEQFIRETFHKFDSSKDGKLDVAEFVPLAYELSKKPIDAAQEIFRKMDQNDDGIVDSQEIDRARANFDDGIISGVLAIADTNRDGQLSFAEFEAQLLFNKPKSQAELNREMAAQLLTFIDANGDGKLTAPEIYKFANLYGQISSQDVDNVIQNLDINNDKALSLTELEVLPQKIGTLVNVQTPPSV
ncbi:unnamed protein product [Auanema sp. JU1783]|nr:unnamed protein product [Auanema sp. JU1783]